MQYHYRHGSSQSVIISILQLLIRQHLDINTIINDIGQTILFFAASSQLKDLVEFLLEHEANANIKDKKNKYPIDYAEEPEIIYKMLKEHMKSRCVIL